MEQEKMGKFRLEGIVGIPVCIDEHLANGTIIVKTGDMFLPVELYALMEMMVKRVEPKGHIRVDMLIVSPDKYEDLIMSAVKSGGFIQEVNNN